MAIQYRRLPLTMLGTPAVNLLSDTVAASLHSTTYVPASTADSDQFVAALTGELASGSGYTTGGQTVASKTLAYHTAASWCTAVAVSTAYTAGQLVTTGGNIHRCITAGTSAASGTSYATAVGSTTTDGTVTWYCEGPGTGVWAASTAYQTGWVIRQGTTLYRAAVAGTTSGTAPTWANAATVGQTVTDGTVTWENVGSGVVVFACANPAWATATFTGARYVVFSDRTGGGTDATRPLLAYIDYGSGQSGQGGTFTVQLNPQGLLFFFVP